MGALILSFPHRKNGDSEEQRNNNRLISQDQAMVESTAYAALYVYPILELAYATCKYPESLKSSETIMRMIVNGEMDELEAYGEKLANLFMASKQRTENHELLLAAESAASSLNFAAQTLQAYAQRGQLRGALAEVAFEEATRASKKCSASAEKTAEGYILSTQNALMHGDMPEPKFFDFSAVANQPFNRQQV